MQVPALSVIVPTYNRASRLRRALEALRAQDAVPHDVEVVVVANNCTDDTRGVVTELQARGGVAIRYVEEPRQGNAHARNTGIAHARAPILAFTDDDVVVTPGWARTIIDTFAAHPEVGFIGGPVLPEWSGAPPAWLTRENWAPIAAVDYGDRALEVSVDHQVCLLTANFALRRAVLARSGPFAPELQRVKDGIGSLEDRELIARLCHAGVRGRYEPVLIASTWIEPARQTRRYHRRWHRGHGRFFAIMRDPEFERSRATVLGAPLHVYRTLLSSTATWLVAACRGCATIAATAESQAWFSLGFLLQRAVGKPSRPARIAQP